MGPKVRTSILLTCLCAAPIAFCQAQAQGDFHMREDDARRLYRISAFAHGHRHGYEQGFRQADEELHVGHLQRTLREKDVPKPKDYKRLYGNKNLFRQGFIYGFMAGYKDSFEERSFRLPEWTAAVPPFAWMSDLPQSEGEMVPDAKLRAGFEAGIVDGYKSGLITPVMDADSRAVASQAARICGSPSQARPEGYCDGFTQGFLFGASDGAANGASGLAKNSRQPQ
jgi:hypothetical protein